MDRKGPIDGIGTAWRSGPVEAPRARIGTVAEDDVSGTMSYLEVRSQRGEPASDLAASWRRFHDFCEGQLRRSLAAYGVPESERDDCIQEIWGRLLTTGLSRFRHGDLRAWVAVLARNKAMDYHRRKGRRPPMSLDFDPEEAPARGEEPDAQDRPHATVWRVLNELQGEVSALSFLVFYLRRMEGLPFREVAETLGLSAAQARLRDCRAMKKFRSLWDREQAEGVVEGRG